MSRSQALALEIAIQDDNNADVVSPNNGRVVTRLTAEPHSKISKTVADYAAEIAQRQERDVIVKITRGTDVTCLSVPPDGSRPTQIDLATGQPISAAATEADEHRALSEDDPDEVAHTADLELGFTAEELATAETSDLIQEPEIGGEAADFDDDYVRDVAPTGPVLISTDDRAHNIGQRPMPDVAEGYSGPGEDVADDERANDVPSRARSSRTRPPRRSPRTGPYVPAPGFAPRVVAASRAFGSALTSHRKVVLSVVGGVVVLAVILAVIVGRVVGDAANDGPVALPATPAVTQDPTSDAVECPTTADGKTVTGRDPGNQSSGAEVIKAFNWAYYQWRNAQAARSMVTANGKVGSVLAIQSAIDVLTPNLRYCLSITESGNDTYDVEISEIPPTSGGSPRVINQVVHTQNIDGRYWITEFAKPTKA